MTLARSVGLVVLLVLLVAGAGAWWYFLGPSTISSAKLVPANTLFFASIPNATPLAAGYETSQLKKLVDSPNAQPIFDYLTRTLGPKNLDLLKALAPDLSGQSFLALTHFDTGKPEETGFVAAMKPKPGLDRFDSFVQQVEAAYPDLLKETKTGKGNLLGVDYQWIEGANAPGRVCVARYHGWIVTTWGEASLQDWLERIQGKSASPSLGDSADYQKSLGRVGQDSQAIVYLDYKDLGGLFAQFIAKTNPAQADYLTKKLSALGGAVIGSGFESGNIVDRFSVLESHQAQVDSGLAADPCPFDTLKFTGPNTRFYFAANVNWSQVEKNLQDQSGAGNPGMKLISDQLVSWAQGEKLDLDKNVIAPLGEEYSLQLEWDPDATYPDLGLFFKLNKPDDFKPTIAAIVDTARKLFATSAVITEENANGHNYATLKMVQPLPIAPTITEDGDYFGIFLNEQHAVRSFSRDATAGLLHNDDFNRQIGDKRQGALELLYFDSPAFLDQAYRKALPFVSMGAMFNPTIANVLKDHQLPPDLTWLAPIGTWSLVVKSDDDGITGYSTSGIGNQGVFLGAGLGGSFFALQTLGFLPHHRYTQPTVPAGSPLLPPGTLGNPTPPVAPAPPVPVPAPTDATTNAAPVPVPDVTAAPSATNTPPAETNPAPATTDSNAPASTPATPPDSTH
jgi:hypothetical protein